MRLNTLSPAPGSTHAKKRVGRGIGSGLGKTAGRGHKGLKSRSGGSVRPGFEGIGLVTAEIRLSELNAVEGSVVDIETLKQAGLISSVIKRAKIFASGEVKKAVTVKGLSVSKGAKAAIEAAGGTVEE
jgi:large subunit ribosomal protein L15